MGWGGRWEWVLGWGTHVHSWLIHVNVWQKTPWYCKVISFQLKLKKKKRILVWVAISFSRGSPHPRDRTQVSCTAGGFFTIWATREAIYIYTYILYVFYILLSHNRILPKDCHPLKMEIVCLVYMLNYYVDQKCIQQEASLVLCNDLEGWHGAGVGGRPKREDIWMHMTDSLHCTAETYATL